MDASERSPVARRQGPATDGLDAGTRSGPVRPICTTLFEELAEGDWLNQYGVM